MKEPQQGPDATLRRSSSSAPAVALEVDDVSRIRSVAPARGCLPRAHVLAALPKQGEVQNLDDDAQRKLAALAPVLEAARRGSACALSKSSTCRRPSSASTRALWSSYRYQRSD